MKTRISEQTILFLSIARWVFLVAAIGVVIRLSTTGFLTLLIWEIHVGKQFLYTFFLLPAAFFLSALIVKYLTPDAKGHGTEKVI